jgi:PAS domain S-box-containing protein
MTRFKIDYTAISAATLAIILLAASAWMSRANFDAVRANENLDARVRSVLLAETLLSNLKDAETGQRGYLMTGNSDYLKPYIAARDRLAFDLANLRSAPQMAGEQPQLDRIQALVATRMGRLAHAIALEQAGRHDAAVAMVRTNIGKGIMDSIRADIDALERDSRTDLIHDQARPTPVWPRVAAVGLGALSSLLLAGVALDQLRARRAALANLAALDRFTRAFSLSHGMLRRLDGTITFWCEGMERLYGYTASEAVGWRSHDLLQTQFPIPLEEIDAALLRDGHWDGEVVHRHRDGGVRVVASHWAVHRGINGEDSVVIETNNDITAFRDAQSEREQASVLLSTIVETAPGVIYAKDKDGRMLLANRGALHLIGKPWAEVEGRTDREFLADAEQADIIMANDRRIMTLGETEVLEEVVGGPQGAPRIWLSTKKPLRNSGSEVSGLVGVSVDITELKRAEERLRLLVHELNHRVKNTLATVQAIASLTLRDGDPATLHGFEGRLLALARAHDILTKESWVGAEMNDIVAGALAVSGRDRDDRLQFSGPALRMKPQASLALVLALHELIMNAVKYGALSVSTGYVNMVWAESLQETPHMTFRWSEAGGPTVNLPTRRGFGLRQLEHSLVRDLVGTVGVDFRSSGLICTIEAPLEQVSATPPAMDFPPVGDSARR